MWSWEKRSIPTAMTILRDDARFHGGVRQTPRTVIKDDGGLMQAVEVPATTDWANETTLHRRPYAHLNVGSSASDYDPKRRPPMTERLDIDGGTGPTGAQTRA